MENSHSEHPNNGQAIETASPEVLDKLTELADEADSIIGHGPTMSLETSEELGIQGHMQEPNAPARLHEIEEEMKDLIYKVPETHEDYKLFAATLSSIRERLKEVHAAEASVRKHKEGMMTFPSRGKQTA